uniref:Uncharacterized protein n=1 Tax=Sipha flava TaxID=143950 RepID=A0A2S2QTP1_9HEMI
MDRVFIIVSSVLAICTLTSTQYIDAECALHITGAGRTSFFDFNSNTLKGGPNGLGLSGQCITYEAINQAYIDARKRINVAQTNKDKWTAQELASVGELLLDISIQLTKK